MGGASVGRSWASGECPAALIELKPPRRIGEGVMHVIRAGRKGGIGEGKVEGLKGARNRRYLSIDG